MNEKMAQAEAEMDRLHLQASDRRERAGILCSNCKWFVRDGVASAGYSNIGHCHRLPPVPAPMPIPLDEDELDQLEPRAGWLQVDGYDFCGEFARSPWLKGGA